MLSAITLRMLWPRLSAPHRRRLQLVAILLLVPSLLTFLSKWDSVNHRVTDIEAWIRIVSCQFAVVFFTLLRPRALTAAIAAILLPFAFSTSVAGPLSSLFRPQHFASHPIADGYILETVPWQSEGGGNSGTDFDLIYKPAHLRFLRRGITGTRFYSTQCDTLAVYAVLRVANHSLDVFCPPFRAPRPRAELSGGHDHYVIPPGALSPALRHLQTR